MPIDECPDACDRCPVKILDKYFEKVPPEAIEEDCCFYLCPLPYISDGVQKSWFGNQSLGKHQLSAMVKTVCEEAHIYGKTNHSLRATAATMMFQAFVPEKVIKEFTGHRSSDGVRKYERTPVEHQQAVSSILASTSQDTKTFKDASKIAKKSAEGANKDKQQIESLENTQPCGPLQGKYSFANCNVTFYMSEPPASIVNKQELSAQPDCEQ